MSDVSQPLPIAAPCRQLAWNSAWQWLLLGWRDVCNAPRVSLSYGMVMLLVSYGISAAAWAFGNIGLYIGVLSGFVFLGPVLALTLYAISARLHRQQTVSFRLTTQDAKSALGDAMTFALALLVVFLVWARAATMLHIFFPVDVEADWRAWATFLGIGSAVGAMFCALLFMASAFALPMMLDRQCDSVTAIVSSINATLRNKPAMLFWVACIGAALLIGLLTAYLAFVVLLPLLGHAAWHAYRETIDVSQWPARELN